MIASRHDVKYALTTILGETPDEIVLDRCTHEVQRRNLSALHLDILTLSRGKFHAGSNGIQDAASSLLDWDEFVRRFVKAKEQYVTSLGSPPEAICQLGEDAWFHSFELSDGTSVRGAKTPGVLSAEFDAVFAPVSLEGQSVLDVGAWNGAFSFE